LSLRPIGAKRWRETVNRIEAGMTQIPEADVRRQLAKAPGVSHLELLIVAGEITEEEVAGAVGRVERDQDPAHEALIERVRACRSPSASARGLTAS
jgi:hypothetical protein